YAAVTGSIGVEAIILFLIIFMWTPPHSWALCLYRTDDYRNCNIPMLPVVSGVRATLIQSMVYSVLTFAVSLLPYFFDMAGVFYLCFAITLGVVFLYYSISLIISYSQHKAKSFLLYSICYLFFIFVAILV